MINPTGLERVLIWLRLRGPASQGVEAADMGTAFGMEMSFDSPDASSSPNFDVMASSADRSPAHPGSA